MKVGGDGLKGAASILRQGFVSTSDERQVAQPKNSAPALPGSYRKSKIFGNAFYYSFFGIIFVVVVGGGWSVADEVRRDEMSRIHDFNKIYQKM